MVSQFQDIVFEQFKEVTRLEHAVSCPTGPLGGYFNDFTLTSRGIYTHGDRFIQIYVSVYTL